MINFSDEINDGIDYKEWAEQHKDELLKSAVAAIDPDKMGMTRDNALTLAGAMKNCGFKREDFAEVMARSSADKGTFAAQWDNFRGEGKHHGPAGPGTIYQYAKESGWKWPNPNTIANTNRPNKQKNSGQATTNSIYYTEVTEDYKIQCLIDSEQYTSKPTAPWMIRSREQSPTPDPAPITMADFARAVTAGQTFSPTVYNKKDTGNKNSKGKPVYEYKPQYQQVFVVDIDNEETALDENGKPIIENGKQKKKRIANPMTIEKAFEICQINGIAPFLIYETFSSKAHRDDPIEPYIKFRICFALDAPLLVEDVGIKGINEAIEYFIGLFGGSADTSTTDPARLIYGTDEKERAGLYPYVINKSKIFELIKNPITLPADPNANKPNEKGPIELSIGGFDDIQIKPTDYLFFPWFPRGKLTAIQGDSSSSKSTFMYAVGARVTTGTDLVGAPCEDPGNVMFITIEDDESDILVAFQDAGGDVSKLRRITDREQITRLDLSPAGAAAIEAIIKEHDIKLLVLDPLQQFLGGDMNKANETRPQMGRLMNIAAENNICLVFLQHMGKDTSKAALHRGVGSVDIGAATRSILQIVTDPQDDFDKIAFTVKNNTADFHETQRAIRYQVKDHPGSYNFETGKRVHYHGHAEFCGMVGEYNERLYKKALRKAEEEEAAEEELAIEYKDDPLVKTARELVKYNPQGLFISTEDLIEKITIVCGRCPYEQSQSKILGINSRASKIRGMMMDEDGIQIDVQKSPRSAKAYNWRGEVFDPQRTGKTRGFIFTPIKNGTSGEGTQQTEL